MQKRTGLSGQLRKLPRGPDLSELHQLLSQALENRGKPIQVAWRGSNLTPFSLEVICQLKSGNAQWNLYIEHGGRKEQLFEYTSVDVLLVYNLVVSSCTGAQQGLSPRTSGTKIPAQDGSGRQGLSSMKAPSQEDTARRSAVTREQSAVPQPPPKETLPPRTGLPGVDTAAIGLTPKGLPQEDTGRRSAVAKPAELTPQAEAFKSGQQAPPAQSPPTAPPVKDNLDQIPRDGDLAKSPIPDLLQTIAKVQGTGRLDVRNNELFATVYIQDGFPVDATAGDVVGDEAMIEMLTWQEGSFNFEPRVLRNSHTVYESIESLLQQSKQLSSRLKALKEAGMVAGSTVAPTNPDLSQQEFIEKVTPNCPCEIDIISRVYCTLTGRQTMEELVRLLQISRIQLVHIVHHLVVSTVVRIANDLRPQSTLTLAPRVIDNAAIQSIMMSLRRAETGMFIYPAFLYFLEQEYFRSYRSRTFFSVVVFEMRLKRMVDGETVLRVLPSPAIQDAVLRISNIKRHVDLVAHYDAYDYALLLPNTRTSGAEVFVNRIIKTLTESPLSGGIDNSQLSLAFGASSVPEDFKELSALLGAADLAMSQARQHSKHLVMYRDIKNAVAEPGA